MTRYTDLTGDVFGFLTVVRLHSIDKHNKTRWECQCQCGNVTIVNRCDMTSGKTKSCGCLRTNEIRKRLLIHGKSGTSEHNIWNAMLQRCNNPGNKRYKNYGGRGIRVCDRWLEFENFYADMGAKPSSEHSIDRINNDGNYEPDNCRWATSKQQSRNKTSNRMFEIDGEERCLSDWASIFGINIKTLRNRLFRSGWNIKRALETPIRGAK